MPIKQKKKDKKIKKKIIRDFSSNVNLHICICKSNIIASLVDSKGVIVSSSGGIVGARHSKKKTPRTAQSVINDLFERFPDSSLKEVDVYVKNFGRNRETAIRSINARGIRVKRIFDVTKIAHGGCRQPRPKR